MSEQRPGPDGSPVPPGVLVLRMAALEPNEAALRKLEQGDFRVLAPSFVLSSEEHHSNQRLSVFVEGWTTSEQAWILVGSKDNRRLVLVLSVDVVRQLVSDLTTNPPAGEAIRWEPDAPPLPLDVVWETAMRLLNGERVRDERLGAEGHAGIANLVACTRKQQHFLREQLATRVSRYVVVESEAELDPVTEAIE